MSAKRIVIAAVLLCVPALAGALQTVAGPNREVKASATIQKIDAATRVVVLKNDDGTEDVYVAGPEIQRFNELKVGDKVNATYYESTVYEVRKPGDPPLDQRAAAVTSANRPLPGGTAAKQTMSTVTVKAVDPSVPSITVTTSDGQTVVRKMTNPARLAGVKVGDRIDIIYTEALLVSVERK